MLRHIEPLIPDVETIFNVAGTIPILGFYSGTVRAIAGKVQQCVGAILAVFSFIALTLTNDEKWVKLLEIGITHILHGALNTLRGFGETFLGLYTFCGIGNLILMIPYRKQNPSFSPRFNYGLGLGETIRS